MADEERRRDHKKQTAKSEGKTKSRWRKPGNILNIGNKERGECFPFQVSALEAGNLRLDKSFTRSMCLPITVLHVCFAVGHAFTEKRKKIALREYKKLLKKTREEHKQRQSSENKDGPLLTRSSQVSDAATISEQVCI